MSDDPFHFLFENSLDAMVIADDQGRYLEVNQAACDLFGYSCRQMLQMSVGDLVTAQSPGASEQYQEYLRTGRETGEFTFVRADKQTRTASYSACRIAPGRHLSILRDITRQKQAEEALRQSEVRFRMLVEQSPLSIQILSPEGWTLGVNRAWEQLWGLTLEQIQDYNMFHDKQLEAKGILALIRRAFAGEAVALPPILYDPDETLPNRTKNPIGGRWTQAVMYPVKDNAGVISEIVLIHEDITEQRLAEDALRSSEERYRTLVVATAQIVWTTDQTGAIFQRTDSWEEFTGQTPDQYMGRGWLDSVHPEDRERTERVWKAAMHSHGLYECEYRLRRGDGTYRHTVARAVPLQDEQGSIREWIGTITDITERVRHLQEIERLNERLRRSIQETHHRVKNNLQMISALVELQANGDSATVPAAAMNRIGQHTRSLAAVHDLLTQQVKVDPHADSISTRATMDRLIPLLQATIGRRRIHYDVSDFDLPVQAGTSLTLLIAELISNAVKHGHGDIRVVLSVEGDTACLDVSDDGPGFPPDFDWRAAANTGLGLIDMAGRYELRGSIRYGNRPQGGGQVVVTFPLTSPQSASY